MNPALTIAVVSVAVVAGIVILRGFVRRLRRVRLLPDTPTRWREG